MRKTRIILKRPENIINLLMKSNYKKLDNNIFVVKNRFGYVVIAITKNYIIFGISSLA